MTDNQSTPHDRDQADHADQMSEIWQTASDRYAEYAESRQARENALQEGKDWQAIEDSERLTNRLRQKGMEGGLAAALVADAQHDPAQGFKLLERIISDSNLMNVHFLRRGAALSQGICRVRIRNRTGRVVGHGTGFLVSPEMIMTNNHVLKDAEQAGFSSVQFDYVEDPAGGPIIPVEFDLEPQRFFFTNKRLDFSLVAVAPVSRRGRPLVGRPWNALIRESGKAIVGEPVNIIQHPRGEPMKVAFRSNTIVDRLPDFLHYETDTEPGSSGSPVCNDRWHIAALHHSGVPLRDNRGRYPLTGGGFWRGPNDSPRLQWVANEGVRISRIVSYLDRRTMNHDQQSLYEACFLPDHGAENSPINKAVGVPAADAKMGAGDAPLRIDEPDGSISWYFKVNIGPAGQASLAQAIAASPASPPASASGPSQPNTPASQAAGDAAATIVKAHQPDEDYYHAQRDEAARHAYYKDINLANPDRAGLFEDLRQLLTATHTRHLGYHEARHKHLYPWVDLRENGRLRNVYSGTFLDPQELIASELDRLERARPGYLETLIQGEEASFVALESLEDVLEDAQPFNCEHVVPQSWFAKKNPMKADLHHLFTCEPSCNSFRNNIPYDDFNPILEADPSLEVIRSDCGQREGRRFEPELGHSIVARATLYFLIRYPGQMNDSSRELPPERLETLITWHKAGHPTRYEKHRNVSIQKAQGNRNPLIDYPELVDHIDFTKGFG